MGTACPGPCNARVREAHEAYKQALALYDPLDPHQSRPQPPDIQPWEGTPVWCSPCQSRISQRLGQLDDLASILQRYADGHREAPAGPMASGTGEPLSPSQAADTAEDLAGMLLHWEAQYRHLRQWPTPRRDDDLASAVTACSAWLASHLRGILTSAIAEQFGLGILSWHRELTGATKAGTRKLIKPLRCPSPSCQQLTLTWVEGEEAVYCSNPECRRVISYAEYEVLVERAGGQPRQGTDAA